MNYEWQRDNILWLKLTKQFLKTKQFKKWSEKKSKKLKYQKIYIYMNEKRLRLTQKEITMKNNE